MRPSLPSSCQADGRHGDVEAHSKFLEGRWGRLRLFVADRAHGVVGELGKVLLLAVGLVAAAFAIHIVHVGLVVAEEKVGRADTGSGVAVMEHEHPFWDGSVFQLPGNAMSHESGSTLSFFERALSNSTVTMDGAVPCPNPASSFDVALFGALFVHTAPEPVRIRGPQFFFVPAHKDHSSHASGRRQS